MSFPGLARFAGRDGDRNVVWLQGENDLSTAVALADTLARAIALDDADPVLDLSEVREVIDEIRLLRRELDEATRRHPASGPQGSAVVGGSGWARN